MIDSTKSEIHNVYRFKTKMFWGLGKERVLQGTVHDLKDIKFHEKLVNYEKVGLDVCIQCSIAILEKEWREKAEE